MHDGFVTFNVKCLPTDTLTALKEFMRYVPFPPKMTLNLGDAFYTEQMIHYKKYTSNEVKYSGVRCT
jgi:hypothetical protein